MVSILYLSFIICFGDTIVIVRPQVISDFLGESGVIGSLIHPLGIVRVLESYRATGLIQKFYRRWGREERLRHSTGTLEDFLKPHPRFRHL